MCCVLLNYLLISAVAKSVLCGLCLSVVHKFACCEFHLRLHPTTGIVLSAIPAAGPAMIYMIMSDDGNGDSTHSVMDTKYLHVCKHICLLFCLFLCFYLCFACC